MIVATPPPALHAPAKPCSDGKTVNLHVSYTMVATSPDCRWDLISVGDDETAKTPLNPTGSHLAGTPTGFTLRPRDPRAAIMNRTSGKVIARFEMERSASAHWLRDGRYLVINYFAGSDSARPLLFWLGAQASRPVDLSRLVYGDVLRRAHKRPSQVYHYYVHYLTDEGGSVTISAEPEYTLHGDEGPGGGKCYVYSVNKTSFRYRFIRELPGDDDVHPCPVNADEKW